MARELCMVERNEKGKQARQYFIECERQLKEQQQNAFQVPTTFTEALRLAADLAEHNDRLVIERDTAVKTKAWISDKKTATSMSRLGVVVKENQRLKMRLEETRESLGIEENYLQVRAICC